MSGTPFPRRRRPFFEPDPASEIAQMLAYRASEDPTPEEVACADHFTNARYWRLSMLSLAAFVVGGGLWVVLTLALHEFIKPANLGQFVLVSMLTVGLPVNWFVDAAQRRVVMWWMTRAGYLEPIRKARTSAP